MAETEGSQNEGTENSAEACTASTAHLSTMHISTYEEMKADNLAQTGQGHLGWAEAVSKDERAQKGSNRHARSEGRGVVRKMWDPHHHITREEKRRHDEWEQTQRDIRASRMKLSPSDVPYVKGTLETFWGKATIAFFRFLRVV
jgi:hypothetical protein